MIALPLYSRLGIHAEFGLCTRCLLLTRPLRQVEARRLEGVAVLEGTVRIGNSSFHLIGIEPLTLPRQTQLGRIRDAGSIDDFLKSPSQTIVSPQTLLELSVALGATPVTDTGHALPPIKPLTDTPPRLLIVDVGVAQILLGEPERLSRLIVGANSGIDAAPLATVTGDQLRLVEPEDEGDLARLTDSFHLNLTAFGLLAFLVGLFIVHASFGLAFEQRLPMVGTMRAVGISARALITVMLIELLMFALIAGTIGMIGGYLIAAALLPDMAASSGRSLWGAGVGAADARSEVVGLRARHGGDSGCWPRRRWVCTRRIVCRSFHLRSVRRARGPGKVFAASSRSCGFWVLSCSRCISLWRRVAGGLHSDSRRSSRIRALAPTYAR